MGIRLCWIFVVGVAVGSSKGMAQPLRVTEQPTVPLETDKGCLLPNCHGFPGGVRPSGDSVSVDPDVLRRSAHRGIACLECHTDIADIPHPKRLKPVNCESCHYENNPRGASHTGQFREFAESIHGQRLRAGDPNAPRCSTCHGGHDTKAHDVPGSRIHRDNIPQTCGECHEKEKTQYTESIHGTELAKKNPDVPVCTNCHGVHAIRAHIDPFSKVYPTRIAETCAECHAAVEIAARYGFSVKCVSTYENSFHGFANKFGETLVANCSSCHGVHNIFPQKDPRSTIHPSNVQKTCGQPDCHPKAVAQFVSGEVHLGAAKPPAFVVRWVRWLYRFSILVLVGGMALHNLFDLRAQLRRRRVAPKES